MGSRRLGRSRFLRGRCVRQALERGFERSLTSDTFTRLSWYRALRHRERGDAYISISALMVINDPAAFAGKDVSGSTVPAREFVGPVLVSATHLWMPGLSRAARSRAVTSGMDRANADIATGNRIGLKIHRNQSPCERSRSLDVNRRDRRVTVDCAQGSGPVRLACPLALADTPLPAKTNCFLVNARTTRVRMRSGLLLDVARRAAVVAPCGRAPVRGRAPSWRATRTVVSASQMVRKKHEPHVHDMP